MPPRALRSSAIAAALGAVVAAGALTGCSDSGGSPKATQAGAGTVSVVASFYPIEYAVQQVGVSHVSVTSLTKPGAEPHDIELNPKDVAAVSEAGLVVYARGFQPAVDAAVGQEAGDRGFDVAPIANLDLELPGEPPPVGQPTPGQQTGVNNGGKDPHFWLDPRRYAAVATAIGQRLAAADPQHAADYSSGAKAFSDRLSALDTEYTSALASCTQKDLVTSHAAFAYLGERYGFTQVPIAGLSPDVEPSPSRLAEIAVFVSQHHVTTIYAETLVEPAFAETVSRTTGAHLATLDPIEGLTSASAGRDYLEVMRSNLVALRAGQGCS